LNYRPNFLASTLKSGSGTSTVGFIGKRGALEFAGAMREGAETITFRHAAQLMSTTTTESASSASDVALARDLIQRRVDGLLLVPSGGNFSSLEVERRSGFPIVVLDREAHGLEADSVVVDNETGAHEAVARLIADGHERIALLLTSMQVSTTNARMRGAKGAIREAGLLLSQSPTLVGVMDASSAADAISHLLDAVNPPTAVFCGNSELTIGVIREVFLRHIPLAVAGFDVFGLASLMPIPLLLVESSGYELGRTGAELLYRRLEDPDRPQQRVVLPTRLREFRGTGATT
jgi:LacI family transcriptional regulator